MSSNFRGSFQGIEFFQDSEGLIVISISSACRTNLKCIELEVENTWICVIPRSVHPKDCLAK